MIDSAPSELFDVNGLEPAPFIPLSLKTTPPPLPPAYYIYRLCIVCQYNMRPISFCNSIPSGLFFHLP